MKVIKRLLHIVPRREKEDEEPRILGVDHGGQGEIIASGRLAPRYSFDPRGEHEKARRHPLP